MAFCEMKRHTLLTVLLLVSLLDRTELRTMPTVSSPINQPDHPDGFWFGTQSLSCMAGKMGSPTITKRSINAPSRTGFRYIHRLIFYRGRVFEWGTGVRGYYFGPTASVYECPVEWEETPAGHSNCTADTLKIFSRNYRRLHGSYNLIVNNCHHFVNRASVILTSANCSVEVSAGEMRGPDEIVPWAAKKLWSAVDFVLSRLPDRA